MAGKGRAQKKKKSQVKKRLNQELQTQVNQRKKKRDEEVVQILATNGAEPVKPAIDEDAGKDKEIPMETLEENVKRMEAEKAAQSSPIINIEGERKTKMSAMGDNLPFDPSSIVANILKKKKE